MYTPTRDFKVRLPFHFIFLLISTLVPSTALPQTGIARVVSHRGACRAAPENTIAAALTAVALGAAYIEADIRMSADSICYLMHDPWVKRTTNGKGRLTQMISSVIDTLDAGSWFGKEFAGEKVPRLSLLLDSLKGRSGLYLDIKTCDPLILQNTLTESGMEKNVFLGFWNRRQLKKFIRVCPGIPFKMKVRNSRQLWRLKKKFGLSVAEIPLRKARKKLMEDCHKAGISAMIYQKKDDPEKYIRISRSGADLINLNDPGLYLRITKP